MLRTVTLRILTGLALAAVVGACAGASAFLPGATPAGAAGFTAAPADMNPNSPRLSAVNLAFDRTDVNVPALVPFILVFHNQEAMPHNVSVYRDAKFQDKIFDGKIFDGPAARWYPVPALAPGTYFFQCDIHPIEMMRGTLHAG